MAQEVQFIIETEQSTERKVGKCWTNEFVNHIYILMVFGVITAVLTLAIISIEKELNNGKCDNKNNTTVFSK